VRWLAIVSILVLAGCATVVSPYDQTSFQQVTSCKAEALTLVEKATTPYSDNTEEIGSVSLDLLRAYEYDAGRKKNAFTLAQWDIVLNQSGDSFAGFLVLWKKRGSLPLAFVMAKRAQISVGFNQIIDAEFGKNREP